jgi:hypothetical protein
MHTPAPPHRYGRLTYMPKPRGREHTTLTETADEVVRVLGRLPGVKMIAPGEIRTGKRRTAGKRFVTAVFTTAGFELIITGQSVQKVAVHTTSDAMTIFKELKDHKRLTAFTFSVRERKPGV